MKHWHNLHNKRRLLWKENARSCYLEEHLKEHESTFKRHSELRVVLYGRTQVGKTTLLLTIMGIKKDSFKTVEDVLRAKVPSGKSSTAAPMYYSCSNDDFWYLNNIQMQDDDVIVELANIRRDLESNNYSKNHIELQIPRKHFEVCRMQEFEARILDLPGLNAASENEAQAVRTIAKSFVPKADLILLIGKADDLGFLRPQDLGMPELSHWGYDSERIRVILTYGYSVSRFFEINPGISSIEGNISAMREHYANQFKRFPGYKAEHIDSITKHIYPIEYGCSWDNNKLLSEVPLIREIRDELLNDLISNIKNSASADNRFKAMFNAHAVVKMKLKDDLNQLVKEITEIQNAKSKCERIIENIDIKKETINTAIEDITNEYSTISSVEFKDPRTRELIILTSKINSTTLKKSDLTDFCEYNTKAVKNRLASIAETMTKDWSEFSNKCIDSGIEMPHYNIYAKFESINIRGSYCPFYCIGWDGDYLSDLKDIAKISKEIVDDLSNLFWDTKIKKIEDIQRVSLENKNKYKIHNGRQELINRNLQKHISELETKNSEQESLTTKISEADALRKFFDRIVWKHLGDELNWCKKKFLEDEIPENKLAYLLYQKTLLDEYQNFYATN